MKNIKLQFKKILASLLIVQMLMINMVPAVSAVEGEVTPTPTEAVTVTSEQAATVQPEATVTPTSVTEVSASPTPTTTTLSAEEIEALEQERAREERRLARQASGVKEEGDPNRRVSATSASALGVNPASQTSTTGAGSTITTGNATVGSAVITNANNNLAGSASIGQPGGATVANTGNGSGSTNNGSATIGNTNTTTQDNVGNINTGLTQGATTGSNTNSRNTGGDSSIDTGDANVTGTVITSVNTNVDGVMVAEFNVADDHTGDIVLDFGANCVSGCGGPTSIANTGNGSGSTNTGSVDQINNNNTFQNNLANVGSELILSADSGNNTASDNTGGNSNITTGDANVAANALTFANNNFAGQVIYGVVNIFGDLVGDIIMTEEAMNNCCPGSITAANTGNGSDSTNNANIDTVNNNSTFQTNDADIVNALMLDAETGSNSTSGNTGGNSEITTGDTDVTANVLNIVNTNLVGGNMWLVLVNEAGNWIGKLVGAPEGSFLAGSSGFGFTIDENGFITATNGGVAAENTGNGSDSVNNADVTQTNNNTTVQNNDANIGNTLDLSANTGGNEASSNTGGNSNITTGDANIIANLVNFVNNNVVGDGKLFVTVVNVFGSWLGDFVGPGQQQREKPSTAVGGNGDTPTTQSGNNNPDTTSDSSKITTTVAKTSQNLAGGVAQGIDVIRTSFRSSTQVAGGGTVESNAIADASGEQKVAGISNQSNAANINKKIRINLAWLLVIIPMAGMAIAGRLALKRVLTKRIN